MIELHQFAAGYGLPNPSPFCMKVETFLRLARLPYEIKLVVNPSSGPYGKAPWIVDEGETIADSRLIIACLNRKYGAPLASRLSASEKAHQHALLRMLEESLYFVLMSER